MGTQTTSVLEGEGAVGDSWMEVERSLECCVVSNSVAERTVNTTYACGMMGMGDRVVYLNYLYF